MQASKLETYRQSPGEVARIESLLSLLPAAGSSALEIGARDGHITRLLRKRYARVVAVDLAPVRGLAPSCLPVVANLVQLPFPDDAFEVVLCAEVLEHIPPKLLEQACSELVRVTGHRLVIGVPFEQDLRIGRTTCEACGGLNPPWGHRTSFSRERLEALLAPLTQISVDLVGRSGAATNPLTTWILDRIGNPRGTYGQDEPCIHCGSKVRPPHVTRLGRLAGRSASALARIQTLWARPRPRWIHLAFEKQASGAARDGERS